MKRFVILLLLAPLAISACKKKSGETTDFTQQLNDMLASRWKTFQLDKPQNPSGVGIYYLKGSTVYSGSYNLPGTGFGQIHFRAASNTKTFTAAAILLLEQQGKLSIDDTITNIIPGKLIPYVPNDTNYSIPYKDRITIRLLLCHCAGVFDNTNSIIPDTVNPLYGNQTYLSYALQAFGGDHTFSFDELVGVNAKNHLSYFEPGADYHYSNTGYAMLGKIIERVSDLPYAEFIRTNFIDPLQMGDSHMVTAGNDTLVPDPTVKSYQIYNGSSYEIVGSNLSGNVAEGSLVTTPRDLAKWAQALYSGNAGLNSVELQKMTTFIQTTQPDVIYGLGCDGYPTDLGIGHNGAHEAFMSVMKYQSNGAVVIIFTNYLEATMPLLKTEGAVLNDIAREALKIVGDR